MADQRKITLRATHATPKNIVLRELPVATPSAGTTIYLYQTHATPKNVILRNPLVLDAPATGVEALSGIATLTLTATGALLSTTALSGTATLAITASGELVSTTDLSGAASLILTATGALVSTTSLSGSASIALTATGDLTIDGAAPVTVEEPTHRSGGAGSRVRLARYWKGKYAGYYNDIEWTEWLLAALSAEVAETPKPQAPKKPSWKIRRIVVEPETYIEKAYPESIGALLELKLETVMALAEQHHSEQVAKIAAAALYKKRRREEEDDIAFLLLAE